MTTLESLQVQMQALQAAIAKLETPAEDHMELDVGWSSVLEEQRVQPSTGEGGLLSSLFAQPPPLGQVDGLCRTLQGKLYTGPPATPPPRRHFIDRQWFQVQKKMELAMQKMISFADTEEKGELSAAAALIRSGWEDAHQQRRRLLAGRGRGTLPTRPDDDRPKLLTREEEEKARKVAARPPPIAPRTVQAWRPRGSQFRSSSSHSNSGFRGKGKGKGKGQKGPTPSQK